MKPGTEYEFFVKDIYECLNRADGLTDVEIQHNVTLKGLSGIRRQIDIFWSFKRAGIPYKVAIECKDYKSRVSLDRVSAFQAVLDDLQGVKGIIATKIGFQKGAEDWAKKHGIQAMVIRHPIDEDWEGRVKDIHLNIIASFVDNTRFNVVMDKERTGGMVVPESLVLSSDTCVSYSAIEGVFNEPGTSSIGDLIKQLPHFDKETKEARYSFKFVDGVLNEKYPISELNVTYDVYVTTEHTAVYGDEMVKAIVKDITEGTESIVDRFGKVRVRNQLSGQNK